MVMYAEIIAIGPFSRDIVGFLEYPKPYYENTREGAIVNLTLFGIVEGTALSTQFAKIFGVMDPWDFNQHQINGHAIDFEALHDFVKTYKEYEKDAKKLEVLSKHGFEFHFAPNG